MEFREAEPSAQVRFFIEQGEPLLDASGNLLYTIGILRDITESKRIEEGLRANEERFRRVAEDSPVMLWECDAGGNFVFLNRAFLDFLGLTPAQVADWNIYESMHPGDRDQIKALDRRDLESPTPFL